MNAALDESTMCLNIEKCPERNSWQIFLITFDSSYCENMRYKPYGRLLDCATAIGIILRNSIKRVKILIDCNLCKDLIDDVLLLDRTNKNLKEARREGQHVKLVIV